jgi:DNA-binding GntR family transcriptional regulator
MQHSVPAAKTGGLPSAQPLSAGRVVPALREAIVNGEFAPGSRLSEQAVASRYGVSRTPVREAFSQLEREGLVLTLARTGVFVRTIDAREAEEIYETREALETQAVRLAARHQTPVAIARLHERLADLGRAADALDERAYTAQLDRFYDLLMELAGNGVLRRAYEALTGPVRRLRRIAMKYPGRLRASYEHAIAIVEAIASGNEDRAEVAMRSQLATARAAVLTVLASEEGTS